MEEHLELNADLKSTNPKTEKAPEAHVISSAGMDELIKSWLFL